MKPAKTGIQIILRAKTVKRLWMNICVLSAFWCFPLKKTIISFQLVFRRSWFSWLLQGNYWLNAINVNTFLVLSSNSELKGSTIINCKTVGHIQSRDQLRFSDASVPLVAAGSWLNWVGLLPRLPLTHAAHLSEFEQESMSSFWLPAWAPRSPWVPSAFFTETHGCQFSQPGDFMRSDADVKFVVLFEKLFILVGL